MSSESTTVVLGWDGLDHELIHRYGMHKEFGEYIHGIKSVNNPVLEQPSTFELWPSIITGRSPEEHGLQVLTESGGASMSNPIGEKLSNSIHNLLSERTRVRIAVALRNRGVSITQKGPNYYQENNLETVFDERRARPIGVPNYRLEIDRELDVISGWGTEMAKYLKVVPEENESRMIYRPRVKPDVLEEWMLGRASQKIGLVLSGINRGYDLIFVWISMLDNVGHTAPVMDDNEWQERGYRHAARLTQEVGGALGEDDDLIVVSDHGHQNAVHTNTPVIASNTPGVVDDAESILDVKDCIDVVTPKAEETEDETPAGSVSHRDLGTIS